ncbi:serine/threonine-protein kinase [Streptomyces sp. NPDC048436]|uniref:serine/threonine-protein kinase n=1 Tax=Streptomyces sp. NPDC048436 TaxID=3365550 RepID=UPI003721532E
MASSPKASPAGHGSGQRYGRWTAGRLLGQGAVGRVFVAYDEAGREAALTVVRPSLARDPEFRARFARGAEALGAVRGRRTAELVDADPEGPVPWLATEYVDGPTLAARLGASDGGPLGAPELRTLASALAEALSDIHRAGLVHGGLRPWNVLLTTAGPRVTGVGVAAYGEGAGYVAPELLVGLVRDASVVPAASAPPADVFSLGAVLVFAATGRAPFGGEDRGPDLADVPAELVPLIAACLAEHPAARPTPRTVARMAGLPLPGSRRRALTLAGTLLLAQLAAAVGPLGGRWGPRTVGR